MKGASNPNSYVSFKELHLMRERWSARTEDRNEIRAHTVINNSNNDNNNYTHRLSGDSVSRETLSQMRTASSFQMIR